MINGSVTNMVANVVNGLPGATSKTGAGGDQTGAVSADGFLQALLGLFGETAPTSIAPPAAPGAASAAAASTAATDQDSTANADGSLSIDPSLLMSLPGWTPTVQTAPVAQPVTPQVSGDSTGAVKVVHTGLPIDVSAAASAEQVDAQTDVQVDAQTNTQTNAQIVPRPVDAAAQSLVANAAIIAPSKTSPNGFKTERQNWNSSFNVNLQNGETNATLNVKADLAPIPIPAALESEIATNAATNAGENALLVEKFGGSRDDSRAPTPTVDPAKLEMEFGLNLLKPVVNADAAPVDTATPADIAALSLSTARTPAQADTQPTTDTAAATLHNRVGTHAWREELGTQLNWMVDNGKHTASLKLSPEHLGPVEVRIDLNKDQASVWFTASNGETRTAIEQALPKLREMMESQGMSLTDAGVFRESPREQQRTPQVAHTHAGVASEVFEDAPAAASSANLGLLDTYA